jgi:hypothetical protein
LGPDGPYEFVARFLVAFSVKYAGRLSALAATLLKFILSEPVNEPCRLRVAACLARARFVASPPSQYVSVCLDICDERLACKLCPVLVSLTDSLPAEDVQKVFRVFTERIKASTDDCCVARLTAVLNKFLKTDVPDAESHPLAEAIVGGTLASFFGRPLNRVFPILPQLCKYVARHIEGCPDFGNSFIEQCSRWLADCYDPVPILRAVRVCDMTRLGSILKRMVEECDVLDVERLGELARTIIKLPPAEVGEDVIALFAPFVEVLTRPADDIAAIVRMNERQARAALADVGKGVFRVYLEAKPATVRVDMLRNLVTARPRDPEWLALVVDLLDTEACGLRFECIAGIGSHFFTELLVGDDDVTKDLRNDMRQRLDDWAGRDQRLRGKLMSQFKLSEGRFYVLCQRNGHSRGVETRR